MRPKKSLRRRGPYYERVEEFERGLIRDALEQSGGKMSAAGKLLGFDKASNIYQVCWRLGLREMPRSAKARYGLEEVVDERQGELPYADS